MNGAASVYVDGALVEVVNLHATAASVRDVVFTTSWPSIGRHTIKVVVSGTGSHTRVDMDGWIRLDASPRRGLRR
jgi:hypothetical protein